MEKTGENMKPSIGRIVHLVQQRPGVFNYTDGPKAMVHLPAIITAVWSETCVNLQVFTDGTNSDEENMAPVKWVREVTLDEIEMRPYTWHWPERV